MKLAALTVHYDQPDCTARLLSGLRSFSGIRRIVAVLHGSFSGEPDFPGVWFIRQQNRGYGAGINAGMQYLQATAPELNTVLICNPDVLIDTIRMNALLEEHVRSGASCTFAAVRERDRVIHGYALSRFGSQHPAERDALFYPATCLLLNQDAWRSAGGFNEEYFHYFEDADFCLRLRAAGYSMHHASSVVIEHSGRSRDDYPSSQLPRYAVRNHLRFLAQTGRLNSLAFLNVSLRHLLYLFRWKQGWRGIPQWRAGIREFRRV